MSDELKQELASVLRITESGIPGANPKVFAEFQGAIFYTITEDFQPGGSERFAPNVDIWTYTNPRLIGLDIDVEMVGALQVTGTSTGFYVDTNSVFVGVELWKPLHNPDCGSDENLWWRSRYHRCTVSVIEPGHFEVRSAPVPGMTMIYTGQVLPESDYTPKI
jgi:hypothetical protein